MPIGSVVSFTVLSNLKYFAQHEEDESNDRGDAEGDAHHHQKKTTVTVVVIVTLKKRAGHNKQHAPRPLPPRHTPVAKAGNGVTTRGRDNLVHTITPCPLALCVPAKGPTRCMRRLACTMGSEEAGVILPNHGAGRHTPSRALRASGV